MDAKINNCSPNILHIFEDTLTVVCVGTISESNIASIKINVQCNYFNANYSSFFENSSSDFPTDDDDNDDDNDNEDDDDDDH